MKKNTLKKVDLVYTLMQSLEIEHNTAIDFYETFFRILEEALVNEGSLKISSFASFIVRQKKERRGRNPKTQIPAVIISRRAVLFHPSKYLRDMVYEGMKKKEKDCRYLVCNK